ncbi:MAG: hypothetical protein AAGD38_08235 [Acidobacteriota bacterium]
MRVRSATRLTLLVLGGLLVATPSVGAIFEFRVVPEPWATTEPVGHELVDGEVRLYRLGAWEPELTLPANVPVEVPVGEWAWVATADGYVSVASTPLFLEPGTETLEKRMVLPVVPACTVQLAGGREGWRGIDRVDVVSLAHGASFPHDPGAPRTLRVPAGEYVAYTVARGAIDGFVGPLLCRAGEVETLPRPGPPPAGSQSFMIHAMLGEGVETLPPVEAALSPTSGERVAAVFPTAVATSTSRRTFFFLDVSSERNWLLRTSHEALRTVELYVKAEDRGMRDLGVLRLKPRRSIALTVDYQPIRSHDSARLVLYACPERKRETPQADLRGCEEVRDLDLVEGVARYELAELDDGAYQLLAEIGDEIVPHLGHDVRPFLDPAHDETPLYPDRIALVEQHVWGHLLEDGEPMMGEVRLEYGDRRIRVFPTDELLEYHLYYFGSRPSEIDLANFPQLAADDLGLFTRPSIWACSEQACRMFHVFSTLVGSGRLDIDLGVPTEVSVVVLDAASREPLEGAWVHAEHRPPELHFIDGERLTETALSGLEAVAGRSDADGRVSLRALPADRPVGLSAAKPGWRSASLEVELIPRERQRVELLLEPDAGGDTRLVAPSGEPLSGAFLLAKRNGASDYHCATTSNSGGWVELKAECRDVERFVLLHAEAALAVLDGHDLQGLGTDLEVVARPERPVVARAVDDERIAVAGAAFEIHFDDTSLSSQDVLAGAAFSRHLAMAYRTDELGELVIPGLSMEAGARVVFVHDDLRGEAVIDREALGRTVVISIVE